MMFEYAFELKEEGKLIREAVAAVHGTKNSDRRYCRRESLQNLRSR